VAEGLEKRLRQAEFVYIRKGNVLGPFQAPYSGPFKVIDRREKVFDIQIGGKVDSISVDRLKPHMGAAPVSPASPPARGRPPGTGGGSSVPAAAPHLGGGPCSGRVVRNPRIVFVINTGNILVYSCSLKPKQVLIFLSHLIRDCYVTSGDLD
jgi:hypothetical protein